MANVTDSTVELIYTVDDYVVIVSRRLALLPLSQNIRRALMLDVDETTLLVLQPLDKLRRTRRGKFLRLHARAPLRSHPFLA